MGIRDVQMRAGFCFAAAISSMFFAGCGKLDPGIPKHLRDLALVPLSGQVILDGAAPEGLLVAVFEEKRLEEWNKLPSPSTDRIIRGTINEKIKPDGKFEFTTFKSGDGLLPGNYLLLFCKVEQGSDLISDATKKFNEKYNNPKTSTVKATLEKGKPVDLGKIELSSK